MDKEKRIEELCEQIRSGDNKTALTAVQELREHGWLTDGSLRGVNLHGANLSKVNLRHAHLRDAILIGTDLSQVDLSEADLQSADLSGSNLNRVALHQSNLRGGYMIGTDLSKAELIGAVLHGANLCEAILHGAVLHGADLRQADLHGADFTKAIFVITVIADVDLSETKGLDTVIHAGPSHLSTDALYKSKGKIPVSFLKGCGIPDDFIEHILPLTGKVIEFYSCFISYSHAQKEFARRLHDRLQGAGIRCWLDEHQVKPGHDIYEEVNRGIRLWDKVLLCCSEESLTSWWVDNEIGVALEKEQKLLKEGSHKVHSIIPLNLDGYMFDKWESGYAAQIRRRLAADFRNWKDHDAFEAEFQKVLAALRTDEGRAEPPVSRL